MKLYTAAPAGATLIQNSFIDRYMVHANGEYVKVYLYLLRCAGTNMELSLSSVADVLEYTEKDLKRALSYWEKINLLRLNYAPDGSIQDIMFTDSSASGEAVPGAAGGTRARADAARASSDNLRMSADAAGPKDAAGQSVSAKPSGPPAPSRARMAALKDQAEIRQLIFVAEQYLQRPLASGEQEDLLYYYDSLKFSADLIEYLLEYCISKGSSSRHYMRRVAIAWAEAGVTTVAQARKETNLYNKNYFAIMNAFGIKGRNPASPELETMSHWINELGFTLDIILEACRRTIQQTHQPNFQYANKILEEWKKQGVHCTADIVALDQKRKSEKKEKQPQAPKASGSNRFNNFNQREYDYSQLERRLLNP